VVFFIRWGPKGEETNMHRLDAVLMIALALIIAAPGIALAYQKKVNTPKQSVSPRESVTFTYTKPQYTYTRQQGNKCRNCN
jgi:hypothetical protein